MHLLALTARLPYPPDRGDRLRAYHFLRSLSRDHEITLLSFIADESERVHISPLQEICERVEVVHLPAWRSVLNVALNLWRPLPLQSLYYRSREMQTLVNRVLSETRFEAVYVHLFRMAQFVEDGGWTMDGGRWTVDSGQQTTDDGLRTAGSRTPHLAHRTPSPAYRILDLTDVISQEIARSMPYRGLLSKVIYTLERPRIERYETWAADHFEETWLISEHDRAHLAARCPQANIRVIRNGVDTQALYPTGEPPQPGLLMFVGHMSVFHNVDAATFLVNEILPLVRAEVPEAAVKLVGAAPSPQIRALEAVPGVQVTGFVDDLNAALNQAAVFVAPLRFAAGVQNKVLEAMATGRAVVTTPLVNRGLGAQVGRDLLTAEGAQPLAAAVIRLLQDADLRRELGQSAREFVQRHYNWDLVRQRVAQIEMRGAKIDS